MLPAQHVSQTFACVSGGKTVATPLVRCSRQMRSTATAATSAACARPVRGRRRLCVLFCSQHKPCYNTEPYCRSDKSGTMPCPAPSCSGILAITTFQAGKPGGTMQCTVCSAEFRSCGAGGKCCNAGGCMQPADAFGDQTGKKRIRCTACAEAVAPADASCQGTLSAPCAVNGRCTPPAAACSTCMPAYSKELTAVYSFLRSSLLAEIADGGQKLDFVQFAKPLRAAVADTKSVFPKKDIAFVFGMQTPDSVRSTVATLQQKFEEAGGRLRDAIVGGKGKSKASPADRMFWHAPAPNFTGCTAQWGGADPWTKGLKGSYYLQRLYVIKTSDTTAFNYQQHLSSLRQVFGKPDQYIMQAPRESYNDYTGGFHYKFTSIYKMAKIAGSQQPVGVVLHGGQLQRCISHKTCPTDEALKRVLRKQ